MTELHRAGFVLRPFTNHDAPAFAAAVRESASSVGRWMSWAADDFSQEQALAWFALCDTGRATGSSHEFGIFNNGRIVGGAGLNHFNALHGFCNLGYWVRASAQRQGAASAAVAVLARHAFDVLAQSRVEIVVAEGNTASIGVAVKAGAVHECLARNRLLVHGVPVAAHVFAFTPDDLRTDPSAPPPYA
jgi:ribosomal-protein-serine acetyltransferase